MKKIAGDLDAQAPQLLRAHRAHTLRILDGSGRFEIA